MCKEHHPLSTIKDIAAEAGVSVMTVSNVINHNHARVSAATEKRIREIMEKHNYTPNMVARSLISKSSRIIMLLLPIWYSDSASILLDPYAGQVVGMLEEILREQKYYVMLCSFEQPEQVLNMQQTWQVDGAILIMPHTDPVTRKLVRTSRTPLVVMDRHFDDLQMLSVGLDDFSGGYLGTKHLLELGHRAIGFAAPEITDSEVIHQRYLGYLKALGEYQVSENQAWVFDHVFREEGGEHVAAEIAAMKERPSAMVTTADLIACGIVKGCQSMGIRVPDDLSVIGFDDSMPAQLISPALTTIGQDIRLKAQTAVDMLMRAIRDSSYRNDSKLLDVSLVERNSASSPC